MGRDNPTDDVVWIRARADFLAARHYIKRGDLTWRDYWLSITGPRRFATWGTPDIGLVWGWLRVYAGAALKLPVRVLRGVYRALARKRPMSDQRGPVE
jgi:hypothetical protein